MPTRLIKILFIILLLQPLVAQAEKLTISVMDLNITTGLAPNEMIMLTDKLLNDLVTTEVYQVVDRSKRDEVLKELGFQQSGACDQGACLVEAGQLLGVQKMIGGTIGKLGMMYSLQLRVIDVKTGGIDKAFSKSYSGDISLLLEGMLEASCYFSGVRYQAAQAAKAAPDTGLTFLHVNIQGYNEYRNAKDGSILIEIPAGPFNMGSNNADGGAIPVHTVSLDKYYISKYEVTVEQYRKYCVTTRVIMPVQPDWNDNDNYPVVDVYWEDAKNYCAWAGLKLPTEAQWEKAARGTDGREYPWGNEWDAAKCNSEEKGDGYEKTSPVGSFPLGISPYGCYDMAGNVQEWVNDWYDDNYYGSSPASNPTGPSSGHARVLRGGCWKYNEGFCRSAHRGGFGMGNRAYPGLRSKNSGFRVAR